MHWYVRAKKKGLGAFVCVRAWVRACVGVCVDVQRRYVKKENERERAERKNQ